MRVIIAGSRDCPISPPFMEKCVIESGFDITEVVSGTARGADKLGEDWAIRHNIPIKRFPADWDAQGKIAGFIRNRQMAEYGQALIALWDQESRGTKHMIDVAEEFGLKIYIAQF